jgi:hypothetical protein
MNTPNKRIKFARRCACPTRNGEVPLLAAYAQRWVPAKSMNKAKAEPS